MSAAAQMFSGGVQLLCWLPSPASLHFPRPRCFPKRGFSLIYLIIAGSSLDIRPYVWLLALRVADKGWHLRLRQPGGRGHNRRATRRRNGRRRTILGTALILVSVVAITTTKAKTADQDLRRMAHRFGQLQTSPLVTILL